MSYDEVITYLGDFGRYQKQIYFLLCLTAISCAFHKLAGVFLLARPDFRCELPFESGTNATYSSLPAELWQLSYPRDSITHKWQTCEYFDVDYTPDYLNGTATAPLTFNTNGTTNGITNGITNGTTTATCERYLYDRSKYANSAVTEWNMVCNRALLTSLSDSLFMVGVLLGSIGFGQLSDKYGRKPIFFASLVIQVLFGVAAGVAPEYLSYTISRMIVGATTSGVFLVAYVIAMEMVSARYRLFAGVTMQMFFSVGFMLTAGFAYFIHDWRWLQIALTLPGLAFMCYYWIIPESARWLLSKNRKVEAIEIIEIAAKVNKVKIPNEVYDKLIDGESNDRTKRKHLLPPEERERTVERAPTIFDLLRTPNMRRKTLLIWFDWFVNSGTYYGLSWNTNNLGDNVLLNFMISGAVEIPGYVFLLFTLNKWGRRSILCGSMLVAGTALMLTVVVPPDVNWLIIALAMLGKLAITASVGTVYIFSVEQFPTVVRNIGMGASSMMARVGGILAPYLNLLGEIWRPLPLVICGAFVFVAGLLSLMLPETHNKPLPETIEDAERFGKKQSSYDDDVAENGEELKNMLHVNDGSSVVNKTKH